MPGYFEEVAIVIVIYFLAFVLAFTFLIIFVRIATALEDIAQAMKNK